MIEMFKIKNELAPPIMDSMFERRNESYNLRNFHEFLTERKTAALWSRDTKLLFSTIMVSSTRKH